MIKITESESKKVAGKRTIYLKGIKVDELRIVDETGDITEQALEALPEGITEVDFKLIFELPDEESEEE